jgi:hypothetical protein
MADVGGSTSSCALVKVSMVFVHFFTLGVSNRRATPAKSGMLPTIV